MSRSSGRSRLIDIGIVAGARDSQGRLRGLFCCNDKNTELNVNEFRIFRRHEESAGAERRHAIAQTGRSG